MLPPLEEPRRSNLIFVPCQEPGEPVRLDQLRRVRKPVSRSQSGVQGKVADVIHGRSRHAESQNELKAFQILVATGHADSWQEQPFTLEYHHEGAKRRYTPDILVIWGARREVVEVKDDQEAHLPENRARFAFISELLAEHGYYFRVWRRSEICAEPRLTNANLILRYRCVVISPPDRERVRRAFSSTPELNLRALCETSGTAVPRVLRLVLEGALHIDWWERFGLESKVSITPVGRQNWPCLSPGLVQRPREETQMSLNALRQGNHVKIGSARFLILQKLSDNQWQLQNTATGEWCKFTEVELLDQFTRNELVFDRNTEDQHSGNHHSSAQLDRALSTYPHELVVIAQNRVQYLKEIDRLQPITITSKTMEPLIRSVSERINDAKAPGWRTLARDYGKWLSAGRDIRAVISRHSDKGSRGPRMIPEVKAATDEVIGELYMTEERKRVPEVHLELVRRLADANRFRPGNDPLSIPSRRTIYREIERRSPYELMVARYGKRRAEIEFRVSGGGPETSRALQRVSMDHTPSDIIVVDDATMLPLGRPTITSALDEHTRCPMGFYMGFEPPSCLSVMTCLKHAILPKTYVPRELPSIKNAWECYGVPELVVVDNPPEFHSSHFERACLQIGTDIQYAKVLVPWYKGKLERFQGTMNHDLMHGNPGTTFSNILERDEYDPTRHAVVMLSTFREMLHKWVIDVYLQTPHRGIKDTPAHRWHSDLSILPPPLPPSASELEVVLGMTAQRVVFHYGIELEGLKYNGPELGELRRRMGVGAKIELTFDPGDLGHVNVLDSQKGTYINVPAVNQAYAKRLSFWQNKIIRRHAQRQLDARTDIVALAQAKAEIRALVERDFNRKSTHGRKRHARFLEDHTDKAVSAITVQPACQEHPSHREVPTIRTGEADQMPVEASPGAEPAPAQPDAFTDDEALPVFEANLDLPRVPLEAGEVPEMHQAK